MKIYITAPFWKENLESLKRDFQVEYASWFQTGKILEGQELADVLNEERAEIFVTEEDIISEEVLALVPGLKMVCVCRGTPSNVDMQAAGKHQIVVANTPGRNAVGVAELVIGMMIAVSRRMREGDHLIRTHQWKEDYYFHSFGEELEGKSCGFIGFGAVARETAFRLKNFGMKLYAYDPYISSEEAAKLGVELINDPGYLMECSDYVSNHLPVTEQTVGMINGSTIRRMKPNAYFINTARAKTLNEAEVLKELKDGRIAGAAFDVYGQEPLPQDSPYLELPNVILLPHIGGSTTNAIRKHSVMAEESIRSFAEHRKVIHRVDR